MKSSRPGHFSTHPNALIAWFHPGTALFGDTNFGVRFAGLLTMLLMQLLLADVAWRRLRAVGYVIAVVLMTEAAPDYRLLMARLAPDAALIACDAVPVVQLNERSRDIDFRELVLGGPVGLYVAQNDSPMALA